MEKLKKILFVHWQSDVIGGAEIALIDLINILNSQYVIDNLFHHKGVVSNYYKNANVKVIIKNIQTKRRKYPGLHTIQSYLLARFLKRKEYDYVVCNTLPATSRVATACRISKTPFLSYVRDHFSYSKINYELLHKPNALIAVSKDMQRHTIDFANDLNVYVVYDFISPNNFPIKNTAKSKKNEKDLFTVGIVGRIQSIKQHHILIKAMKILTDSGRNIELLIYGESGPTLDDQEYYKMIKQLVTDLGLLQYVHFKGFHKDIIKEICKLNLLVVPSKNEAFPRVILEAQLCHIPVLGANTGGIVEQIDHLNTGILVDLTGSDPSSEIAKSIVMLYNNKKLLEKIADNAYEHCLKYFASKEHAIESFTKPLTSIICK